MKRLNLMVPEEWNTKLNDIAYKKKISKAELIRKVLQKKFKL